MRRTPVSQMSDLAASWYIALPSHELARKPKAVELFGEQLVAWRDGRGEAVLMPRHCPHMGASLALGKVVDGCLRCPFHHWRFDASGECVAVPGVARIPPTARQAVYPVVEKYGFLWAWYGGQAPLFPLPEFPALEADRERYMPYRFHDVTRGSPRTVLENAYAYHQLITLHGLSVSRPPQLRLLETPDESRHNGPPIHPEAWMGALTELPMLSSHRLIFKALGIKAATFNLLVDGWPGGQRLTFFVDEREIYKELLAITPVSEGRTIRQGWAMIRKTGNLLRDRLYHAWFSLQHRAGTRQDIAMYDDMKADRSRALVKYDRGVLKFRQHYQKWVERAHAVDPVKEAVVR